MRPDGQSENSVEEHLKADAPESRIGPQRFDPNLFGGIDEQRIPQNDF